MQEKNIELTSQELEFASKLWGLTEEQKETLLPNLTAYQKRFIRHFPDFFEYKIMYECVHAFCCAMQARKGDRIVFSALGDHLPEESYFGPHKHPGCGFAIQAILPQLYTIQERICHGLDPNPRGLNVVKCMDVDPHYGGTGYTVWRTNVIKEKVNLPVGTYRVPV